MDILGVASFISFKEASLCSFTLSVSRLFSSLTGNKRDKEGQGNGDSGTRDAEAAVL